MTSEPKDDLPDLREAIAHLTPAQLLDAIRIIQARLEEHREKAKREYETINDLYKQATVIQKPSAGGAGGKTTARKPKQNKRAPARGKEGRAAKGALKKMILDFLSTENNSPKSRSAIETHVKEHGSTPKSVATILNRLKRENIVVHDGQEKTYALVGTEHS